MKAAFRVLVCGVVVLATYYFVYWLPFSLIPIGDQRWIARIGSLFCAVLAGRFVWSSTRVLSGTLISSVMVGAIVIGAIGFAAGFFGPLILAPDANQGPLLGIFITGPLGFVAGAVGGFVYWFRQRPQ